MRETRQSMSKYRDSKFLSFPLDCPKKMGTWLTRQSKHELSTKSGRSHCKLFDRQSWSRLRGATDGRNGARRDLTPMWCISFVIVPLTVHHIIHIYINLISFDIIWFHWHVHSGVSRICWHTWGRSYPQHVGYRIKINEAFRTAVVWVSRWPGFIEWSKCSVWVVLLHWGLELQ